MTEKTIKEILSGIRAVPERGNKQQIKANHPAPSPLARSLFAVTFGPGKGKIPGPYNRKELK